MRAYVAELERKRFAVTARPRARAGGEPRAATASDATDALSPSSQSSEPAENARAEKPKAPVGANPRQRGASGRYVPAAIRRAVFERDGGCCSYVDASGTRCRETRCLELHHLTAFARGGEHSEENLTLRCAAHNALAAEEDFGRDFVEHKRDALAHESFASNERHGFGEEDV